MTEKPRISYEEAKRLASNEDPAVRRALARKTETAPEILYYLAEDPSPEVRRIVAANASTPRRADLRLAQDEDDSVRSRLAQKIANVAPGLSADERSRISEMTLEALDILARDAVTQVRQVLSETLKDVTDAPPGVIRRLARDVELVVSGPILENSPVLTDSDLVEIISEKPVQGALKAISKRAGVTETVSDAIIATNDREAVATLLGNDSAQIRETALDYLIEMAPGIEEWHEPLILRPALPVNAAMRLARFVADNLVEKLAEREHFNERTVHTLRQEIQRRLETPLERQSRSGQSTDDDGSPQWREFTIKEDLEQAKRRDNLVDEESLRDALADGDNEFVIAALATLANVSAVVAERIVAHRSVRGVAALALRVGLSDGLHPLIQVKLCGIAPDRVLRAKSASEPPLSEDEIAWQIDFYARLDDKPGGFQ